MQLIDHLLKEYTDTYTELQNPLEDDVRFLGIFLNSVAIIYSRKNNLEKAQELYLKAIEVMEKRRTLGPSDTRLLSIYYSNAAELYYKQGNALKAAEFYLKGIKAMERAQSVLTETNSILFCQNTIKAVTSIGSTDEHRRAASGYFYEIGDFWFRQEHPLKAEEPYLKAIQTLEKITMPTAEDNRQMSIYCQRLATIYSSQNKHSEAQIFSLKSVNVSTQVWTSKNVAATTTISNSSATSSTSSSSSANMPQVEMLSLYDRTHEQQQQFDHDNNNNGKDKKKPKYSSLSNTTMSSSGSD